MTPPRDVEPLTEFQQNAAQTIDRLTATGAPVFLTVEGEARAVLQDVSSYQRLIEKVEAAEVVLAVRQGLDEAARGEGFELDDADTIMRRELGFPPRL